MIRADRELLAELMSVNDAVPRVTLAMLDGTLSCQQHTEFSDVQALRAAQPKAKSNIVIAQLDCGCRECHPSSLLLSLEYYLVDRGGTATGSCTSGTVDHVP